MCWWWTWTSTLCIVNTLQGSWITSQAKRIKAQWTTSKPRNGLYQIVRYPELQNHFLKIGVCFSKKHLNHGMLLIVISQIWSFYIPACHEVKNENMKVLSAIVSRELQKYSSTNPPATEEKALLFTFRASSTSMVLQYKTYWNRSWNIWNFPTSDLFSKTFHFRFKRKIFQGHHIFTPGHLNYGTWRWCYSAPRLKLSFLQTFPSLDM